MATKKSAASAASVPDDSNDSAGNWDEQVEFLRGLAYIVRDEHLSELCVESSGLRLSLKGATPGATLVYAAPVATPAVAGTSGGDKSDGGLVPIVSPMVGMFYRAPSPNDPSFVEVGDSVMVGQVVGVIEAMKVFNEIISEVEGIVAEIPVENADLVETGATLVLIKKP